MHDSQVAASEAVGDARALHSAYDAYADRVYDYALSLTGDGRVAAEVTRDVFRSARELLDQPRDPDLFRARLYALTRSTSRVRLGGGAPRRRRTGSALTALGRRAEALAELLPPAQAEAFELAYRHGLTADELEVVLGVSGHRVLGLLVVVRERLERDLGVTSAPGRLPDLGLARAPAAVRAWVFEPASVPPQRDPSAAPGRHRERIHLGGRPRVVPAAVAVLVVLVAVVLGLRLVPDGTPTEREQLTPSSADTARAPGEGGPAEPAREPAATPGPKATEGSDDDREPREQQGTSGEAGTAPGRTPTGDEAEAAAPRLRVTPRQVTLSRTGTGSGSEARIDLTAVGGDLTWVAILMGPDAGLLGLSLEGGSLAEGESTVVTLSAGPGLRTASGPVRVLFQPGSAYVEVLLQGPGLP